MSEPRRPQGKRTTPGFNVPMPEWDEQTEVDPPPAAPQSDEPPPIEVVVVQDRRAAYTKDGALPWRAYEIWTSNRIYMLDAEMTCMAVVNRESGRQEARHAFIGAKLTGGERMRDNMVAIAYPLPVPGTEAVFRSKQANRLTRFGRTSKVERVIVRLRLTAVQLEDVGPAWDQITQVFKRSPAK